MAKAGEAFYGKLKAGYLHEDVSAEAGGRSVNEDDSGFSWGIGTGWRANENLWVEAGYTRIEEDVSFISVGGNYSF